MISEQLKVATRLQHRQVERQLGQQLFSPTLTREGLSELLRGFQSAYCALETICSQHVATAQLLSERSKLSWLAQDIAVLERHSSRPALVATGLDRDCASSEATSEGQAWGTFYVMEGATLGGQVITRQLSRHAWLTALPPLVFFNSYGAQQAQRWQEFLFCLNTYADKRPDTHPDIIDGALLAFATIARALPVSAAPTLNSLTEKGPHETAV